MSVAAGFGVTMREYEIDTSFAEYLLRVGREPDGVIGAKKPGVARIRAQFTELLAHRTATSGMVRSRTASNVVVSRAIPDGRMYRNAPR